MHPAIFSIRIYQIESSSALAVEVGDVYSTRMTLRTDRARACKDRYKQMCRWNSLPGGCRSHDTLDWQAVSSTFALSSTVTLLDLASEAQKATYKVKSTADPTSMPTSNPSPSENWIGNRSLQSPFAAIIFPQ